MADLFKALKPHASLAKNGFDLSRKHVFSSQNGMALPCLAVETVPNDYFEIDLASLSRTQTLNTAAFLRGKQRFDFFFVPYSQMWHPFNQFISQRTDKHSTLQKGHIYCPVISLAGILQFIYDARQSSGARDMMYYRICDNAIRLLDLLGYGDFRWIMESTQQNLDELLPFYADKYVNVWRLAAYQHIWYDYYRNKYYDVDDTGGIGVNPNTPGSYFADYVSAFNFDDIDCSTFANSIIPTSNGSFNSSGQPVGDYVRLTNLLGLRYIQWKKDLFTTALPSQQFGVVSSVDLNGVMLISSVSSSSSNTPYVASSSSSNALSSDRGSGDQYWSIPSAFDVLSLRKAEALQQWKQNTLRAGQMTDDSFEAHYGVKPYYEGDENVNYLGSFSSALQINSVEATAASASASINGSVGDLAATGTIVVNGSKLKFECKDFGVIVCIASFLPESEYSSNALDKANTLYEQFDYFTPEFQNIGLEAVALSNVNLNIDKDQLNQVIGYAPRYWMYKTAVDKVFGEFKDTASLYDDEVQDETIGGSLEAWVAPRAEFTAGNNQRYLKSFYVNPQVFDNVIGVRANSDQHTDYLIHNVFFDIKAIRPMSVLGLPQF